jgi:hypothetical protein
MATIRLLDGSSEPFNGLVELARGDSITLSSSQGFVLLSVDDVDETFIPTAQLTPDEAEILASKLNYAARKARALSLGEPS